MPTQDELKASFAAFDLDSDGCLSAEEVRMILTRPGGGSALTLEDAQALIDSVDENGDGKLQVEEFCALMATPGTLTLLPAPSEAKDARVARFLEETKVCKATSPVKALFEKIAQHDTAISSLRLHVAEADNALNMELYVLRGDVFSLTVKIDHRTG